MFLAYIFSKFRATTWTFVFDKPSIVSWSKILATAHLRIFSRIDGCDPVFSYNPEMPHYDVALVLFMIMWWMRGPFPSVQL
jgi:hypothetical protein